MICDGDVTKSIHQTHDTGETLRKSPADRQRLKRQRRAEAGMVKCEVWLSAEEAAWVRQISTETGNTSSSVVKWAVRLARSIEIDAP